MSGTIDYISGDKSRYTETNITREISCCPPLAYNQFFITPWASTRDLEVKHQNLMVLIGNDLKGHWSLNLKVLMSPFPLARLGS